MLSVSYDYIYKLSLLSCTDITPYALPGMIRMRPRSLPSSVQRHACLTHNKHQHKKPHSNHETHDSTQFKQQHNNNSPTLSHHRYSTPICRHMLYPQTMPHQPDLVQDILQDSRSSSLATTPESLTPRERLRSFFRWNSLKSRITNRRNCHSLDAHTKFSLASTSNNSSQQTTPKRRPMATPIIVVENYDLHSVKPIRTNVIMHPQTVQAAWGHIAAESAIPLLPSRANVVKTETSTTVSRYLQRGMRFFRRSKSQPAEADEYNTPLTQQDVKNQDKSVRKKCRRSLKSSPQSRTFSCSAQ